MLFSFDKKNKIKKKSKEEKPRKLNYEKTSFGFGFKCGRKKTKKSDRFDVVN